MSYFAENYASFRLPIMGAAAGFRPAQLAAMHAVAAHFFNSQQPAIVTMPTGSGKTAVLASLAFLLRAKRVLVLTPSRLVREQIAEKFESLSDLKTIEALDVLHAPPSVACIRERPKTVADWERLRTNDVVVATVSSISSIKDPIPDPPVDLFDVVFVDEGHHAPAATWARVLAKLQGSRQVLLTATPFRRDEKEIRGRMVFTYDVRRAYEDGVFGKLNFQAVQPNAGQSSDQAIAKATEAQFKADRKRGLNHLIMVRVDGVDRGRALKKVYEDNTGLKLDFITGASSLSTVQKTVERLRKLQIDGIICVNMFGEGFDLPNLKIAAVHSPHKSLAITLQFIGRFARTNRPDIGDATFLAEPGESSVELKGLYSSTEPWEQIVSNLSAARVFEEARIRQVLGAFTVEIAPELPDFSILALRPYFHVKILKADGVDLDRDFPLGRDETLVFRGENRDSNTALFIVQTAQKARWSNDDRIINVKYDLYVVHFDARSSLLFLCTSQRSEEIYRQLSQAFVDGSWKPLPAAFINRALNDLVGAEFFNVGMRKRHGLGRAESYRMIFGPNADRSIQDNDGRLYDRGHAFGKGVDNGTEVTIGISTASKVWSNRTDSVAYLLEWCDALAVKIDSGSTKKTGSGLDKLSTGVALTHLPAGIVAASWPSKIYMDPPIVLDPTLGLFGQMGSLTDFDISIVKSEENVTVFRMSNGPFSWDGKFSLDQDSLVTAFDPAATEPDVEKRTGRVPISVFLSEYPPRLFTETFDVIDGTSLFTRPDRDIELDLTEIEVVDWAKEGISITLEKPDGSSNKSIFEWIEARLVAEGQPFVFIDDGAGEVADYISLSFVSGTPKIQLYHCKASGQAKAGSRVTDMYDVCGQAIKCAAWVGSERLLTQLKSRMKNKFSRCVVGNIGELEKAFAPALRQKISLEVYIIQPGLSLSRKSTKIDELIAAMKSYTLDAGFSRAGLIISA